MKTPCMATQTVFMGMHMLITIKPEAVKYILFEREKFVKMTHVSHDGDRLIAQGVFSTEGDDWHHQRTGNIIIIILFIIYYLIFLLIVLNPSFKYKKLRSLVPLFCETTANLIGNYLLLFISIFHFQLSLF